MKKMKGLLAEIEISFLKGSGPGGQNRNKRLTGVRATDPKTGLVAMATERRSQSQNLSLAIERLNKKLEAHFHVELPRVPTKKTKASLQKRLKVKRRSAQLKKERRKKIEYDD